MIRTEGGLVAGASFGLIAALLLGLGLLVALLPGHPTPADAARECQIVAGVARSLGVREVMPTLEGTTIDCRDAFVRVGVPLAGPPVQMAFGQEQRGVRFSRPRMMSHDGAVIDMGVICGGLCGHGERINARLSSGGWVVVRRQKTWIA